MTLTQYLQAIENAALERAAQVCDLLHCRPEFEEEFHDKQLRIAATQIRALKQAAPQQSAAPASKPEVVAAKYLDEIDAARAGEQFMQQQIDKRQGRSMTMEYGVDEGSQAPRLKWCALFDDTDNLLAAYLLTRDMLNRTQLTLVDTSSKAEAGEAVQSVPAWRDELIDAMQSYYDREMITENDSGDELIRLRDAITAIDELAANYAAPVPAQPAPSEAAQELMVQPKLTLALPDYEYGKRNVIVVSDELTEGPEGEERLVCIAIHDLVSAAQPAPARDAVNVTLLIDELLHSWNVTRLHPKQPDTPEVRQRRMNARFALETAIDALQSQPAAVTDQAKDAERYRWLRRMIFDDRIIVAPDRMLHGDELDFAIDAAIAASKEASE